MKDGINAKQGQFKFMESLNHLTKLNIFVGF